MPDEKQHNLIDSIIGHASTVEGGLKFGGGLRVDGRIRGNVEAEPADSGYLFISRSGRIEGNVKAARVVVGGEVLGNLHVSGMVELQSCARIYGDIYYYSLAMQAGAAVSGMISHQPGLNTRIQVPRLKLARGLSGICCEGL